MWVAVESDRFVTRQEELRATHSPVKDVHYDEASISQAEGFWKTALLAQAESLPAEKRLRRTPRELNRVGIPLVGFDTDLFLIPD